MLLSILTIVKEYEKIRKGRLEFDEKKFRNQKIYHYFSCLKVGSQQNS